jgi:hypothetical protein
MTKETILLEMVEWLDNTIRKDTIELKKRIKELELINESHKNLNRSLRTELNKHKEEERIEQRNKKEGERITKL